MPRACSPIQGIVAASHAAGPHCEITLEIAPEEPVFRGHYPGHPIFPGVCIVDFVQRGALLTHPEPGSARRLTCMDRVRFLDPVRPGDRLTAQLTWREDGTSLRCTADVATERGRAARLTLLFDGAAADTEKSVEVTPKEVADASVPLAVPITPAAVKQRIPHRYPMLLVDRVVGLAPERELTALKAVTCNEPWYAAVTDEAGDSAYDYPAALVIESWCQAASLLLSGGEPTRPDLDGALLLFGGMSGVRLLRPVRPGDVMRHRVRLSRSFGDTFTFEGESTVDGERVLEVDQIVIAVREPDAATHPAGTPEHVRSHP
ncbi:3-hydroxyacyl-ACP dehydratase FabZ family protein [Streptomyces griseofuscus]|uniref:3-hydroxyacyl-ACP dehydratase FabZ family protein n=1 Tax=Streptomyces griseofuscus TaxID=146922 RepID=UPI00380B44CC